MAAFACTVVAKKLAATKVPTIRRWVYCGITIAFISLTVP